MEKSLQINLFNNKENKKITFPYLFKCLLKGKEIWHSRSVATGVVILMQNPDKDGDYFVLLEKRSEKMDHPLLWCFPCGYLDWDEELEDSTLREVWEETGLYLPDYEKYKLYKTKDPFYIGSELKNYRQNVHLFYGYVYIYNTTMISDLIMDTKELSDIRWVSISNLSNYNFAFDHDKRIMLFLKKYLNS
jgi:8-oxo-dGTP pyrophosphatase MutT (NUDIX family)